MTCSGKGSPVQGCGCPWCRLLRPPPAPVVVADRLSFPTGDFLHDEDRRG